jgi:hypothetical protein
MKAGTPGVYLKFQNETTSPLNLTILNFEPSWGIEKVFPLEMDYYTVDPGSSVDQELELYLPDNWDPKSTDPVDCFKAFITAQATSFRSLVLPKLSVDGTATKGGSESTNSDLDMLLDELDVPDGPGRHVRLVRRLRGSWVTAEIEVCTIPAGSCTTHDENDSTDE